ncbi:MAG: SPOR domain-containing protein [Thiohalocapsa sp.]
MTLDYRKGAPPRPRKRNQPRGTCAFWFLLGGLLGAFGVGVAWMMAEQPGAIPIAANESMQKNEPPKKPEFTFFSTLKEEEVVVPAERAPEPMALPPPPGTQPAQDPPTKTAKAAAPMPAPKTSAGPNSYVLQVGSFRKTSDAERLKAQLAMLGIQTSVQTVTIASGQTYHRVRTGSYAKSDANALKSRLKSNGHDAMMMKAR